MAIALPRTWAAVALYLASYNPRQPMKIMLSFSCMHRFRVLKCCHPDDGRSRAAIALSYISSEPVLSLVEPCLLPSMRLAAGLTS
jgi:hypothetical protein